MGDVGALHQAQADVCMPQTVGPTGRSSGLIFGVETKLLFVEDRFKKLPLPLGEHEIGGLGRAPLFSKGRGGHRRFLGRVHATNAGLAGPASKSLKGQNLAWHALAISDAALSAHFNLQDARAFFWVGMPHGDCFE